MLPWLRRLHHDLVKRLLWPARDCRDMGVTPNQGELVPSLVDDEGTPIGTLALWEAIRQDAPPHLVLKEFTLALELAAEAAERGDIEGVLQLEAAFHRLVEQESVTK